MYDKHKQKSDRREKEEGENGRKCERKKVEFLPPGTRTRGAFEFTCSSCFISGLLRTSVRVLRLLM